MAAAVMVSTRVSPEIKTMAEEVLEKQGLDFNTAIRMFITKIAYEKKIPLSFDSKTREEELAEFQKVIDYASYEVEHGLGRPLQLVAEDSAVYHVKRESDGV